MSGQAKELLADFERFGRIYQCDGGCIHLQVGPVNLSLTPEAYMQLVDMVNRSAAHFETLVQSRSHQLENPSSDAGCLGE